MPTYRVDRPDRKPRIVDAPNSAAARQHVAKSEISVSLIGATDAFELAQDPDIKLERAGVETKLAQDAQPPLELGQAGAGQDADEQGRPLEEKEIK